MCRCVFKETTCPQNWKIHIFVLSGDIWEVFLCIVLCCVKVNVTSIQETKGKQGLKYDTFHLTMEAFTTQCYAKVLLVCWQMMLRFVGKCWHRVRCTTEAGWLIKEAIQWKQTPEQKIQVDVWALKLKVFIKKPFCTIHCAIGYKNVLRL